MFELSGCKVNRQIPIQLCIKVLAYLKKFTKNYVIIHVQQPLTVGSFVLAISKFFFCSFQIKKFRISNFEICVVFYNSKKKKNGKKCK